MVRLSITLAALAASALAQPLAGEMGSPLAAASTTGHRTFVVFGASWCAPCIAELRNMAALAAAAGPDRVVIAWADGGIRHYRRMLPPNVSIAPPAASEQLKRRFAPDVRGLPYTVLLDDEDRKCAAMNAPLSVAAIDALRRACGSGIAAGD